MAHLRAACLDENVGERIGQSARAPELIATPCDNEGEGNRNERAELDQGELHVRLLKPVIDAVCCFTSGAARCPLSSVIGGGQRRRSEVIPRLSELVWHAIPGTGLDHDVDESPRHHDHFPDRSTVDESYDIGVGERGGLDILVARAGRNLDLSTELAVHLNGDRH